MFFHIYTAVPPHRAKKTGDFHFAADLARALERRGHKTEQLFFGQRPRHREPTSVSLNLCGNHFPLPEPDMATLLWVISNPQMLPVQLARQYDWVASASQFHSIWLGRKLGRHVPFIPQFSDTDLFHPPNKDVEKSGIFFAGNMQINRFRRALPEAALRAELPIEIVGRGWKKLNFEGVPQTEWIDQKTLVRKYQEARLVLNSHRPTMSLFGFHNNRTLDALATGTEVISDIAFGDPNIAKYVQVCRDPDELQLTAQLALDRPALGTSEQHELHAYLRQKYSATARVEQIEEAAAEILSKSRKLHPVSAILSNKPSTGISANASQTIVFADDTDLSNAIKEAGVESKFTFAETPEDVEKWSHANPNCQILVLLSPPGKAPIHLESHSETDLYLTLRRWERITALLAQGLSILCVKLWCDTPQYGHISLVQQAKAEIETWDDSPIGPLWHAEWTVKNWLCNPETTPEHATLKAATLLDQFASRLDQRELKMRPREIVTDALHSIDALEVRTTNSIYLIQQTKMEALGALRFRSNEEKQLNTKMSRPAMHYVTQIEKPNTPRLDRAPGVFLHFFFEDMLETFITLLDRIPVEVVLYVSTDTTEKAEIARSRFSGGNRKSVVVRVFENRGRDVYAKLWGFKDVYCNHDIVLHLHTKRSDHSSKLGGWLDHISECLLANPETINAILAMFKNVNTLGILAPKPYPPLAASVDWRLNYSICQALAALMGAPKMPNLHDLQFPVGNMFWARTDALHSLLQLDLQQANFPIEAGQLDGTLAHGVERMIATSAQQSGHRYIQVGPATEDSEFVTRHAIEHIKDLRSYLSSTA